MALDPLIAAFLDAARNRRTDKPPSLLEMRQATEVNLQKFYGPLEQVASVQTYSVPTPATSLVNEYDPLRDEAEAYVRQMDSAGVEVKSVRLVGLVHASIHMLGFSPQARQLFDHARAGLQGALKFSAEAAI